MHGILQYNITVDGEVQLHEALVGRLGQIEDLRPVFRQIAGDIKAGIVRTFNAEGADEGKPAWQPLSKIYAEWKAKHFPGKPILQRSGKLMAAFTGGAGYIEEITEDSLEIGGQGVPYAIYHQSHRPRKSNLPRRAFLMLSDAMKERISRYIVLYINKES